MLGFCRDLCRSKKEKDRLKKEKKDKHGGKDGGKDDGKGAKQHKMKNVHSASIIGQGKKNVDQDTILMFEMIEENTPIRFFGIFDGHGDFGREVRP